MAAKSVKAQAHNSAAAISSTSAPFIPGADVATVDIHPPLSVRENNQVAAHAGGVEIAVDVPAAIQPAHIFPNEAFNILRLKCPTIRRYIGTNTAQPTGAALRSGLNRTLAPFENGQENAHQACSTLPGVEQSQFDAEMAAGREPTTPCYTCEQARVDGSTTCPTGGCSLPTGEIAEIPADLLTWDCNTNEVGLTEIAKSIIASEFANNIVSVNDELYAYHDGIYSSVRDITLSRVVLPHLGRNVKPRHIAEIVKMIHIQCEQSIDIIRPNRDFICFSNGTLNVRTGNLEPHSPAHMLLNRIPHAYSVHAGCEGFMTFLNRVWDGDRDCVQKIQLIRQWIGYLLVSDSSMQKMLILNGQGANGKSVLMDIIRHIVGEKNTSSAMLDRLRQSYVRATMEGKLLNVSADLPKKGIVADGDLKALISGDAIEVALKHKPSRTIKAYVRLMVATNNMPDCKDTSDGYFRRLMVLTFNHQIPENERNPNLLQSLLPEIPGIIAWALQGLFELRTQDHFSIPESSLQAVQLYREEISPVRIFADQCLAPSTDRSGVVPSDLFMAFKNWCRDRGFDAGNMITLGRELSTLGFEQRKSGKILWLVKVREEAQKYFRPSQIVPGIIQLLPASGQTQTA
ncbi:MAG: phage/plasmid primase, P4 family [Pseudomonadota bacterium]